MSNQATPDYHSLLEQLVKWEKTAAKLAGSKDEQGWFNEGKRNAYWNAGKLIHDNRQALKASLEPALQFRMGEPLYPRKCRMVDTEGQYLESQLWIPTNEAITLANALGFQAKFVGGKPHQDHCPVCFRHPDACNCEETQNSEVGGDAGTGPSPYSDTAAGECSAPPADSRIALELNIIEHEVNEACKLAYDNALEFPEPINWGDLSCADVRYCTTLGGEFYEVVVEEAAPGCSKLCSFIHSHLSKHGFKNVEVRTEW